MGKTKGDQFDEHIFEMGWNHQLGFDQGLESPGPFWPGPEKFPNAFWSMLCPADTRETIMFYYVIIYIYICDSLMQYFTYDNVYIYIYVY